MEAISPRSGPPPLQLLCETRVFARIRSGFIPKAGFLPPSLENRLVQRAGLDYKLLTALIQCGFHFESLDLTALKGDDALLDVIKTHQKKLHTLSIEMGPFHARSLLDLMRSSRALRHLRLGGKVSESFLEEVSKARPDLHSLHILGGDSSICAEGARRLSSLRSLHLGGRGWMESPALTALLKHKKLERLCVRSVTDLAAPEPHLFAGLVRLEAPKSVLPADRWLELLLACPSLRYCRVAVSSEKDGIRSKRQVRAVMERNPDSSIGLEELHLKVCQWTEQQLIAILQRCSQVRQLALKFGKAAEAMRTCKIFKEGLKACESLRQLSLIGLTITQEILNAINQSRPGLESLRLRKARMATTALVAATFMIRMDFDVDQTFCFCERRELRLFRPRKRQRRSHDER